MNLFSFNKRKREAQAVQAPAQGISVRREIISARSPKAALQVSAVYAAVRIISDAIGSLPLRYQRYNSAQKSFVDYVTDPLFYALTVRPNSRMTSFILFKNIAQDILLKGNAYVLPLREDGAHVSELILINPDSVNFSKEQNLYTINDYTTGISGVYSAEEVLHFKNTSLDGGYTGVSTLEFARTQLSIAATSANETLDRFATGGRAKMILHTSDDGAGFSIDDEEADNKASDIQDQLNQGADVLVDRSGGKLEQMSLSSADLQFVESEKFNLREVSRFFGVPLSKLGEDGGSSYTTIDAANIALYSECLRPILNSIENEFSVKLISQSVWNRYKFSFDTTAIYLADKITEADYLTKRISNGTMTINEARQSVGMTPVSDGDSILVSTNLAALGSDKINGGESAEPAPEPGTRERDERGRFVKSKKNG